MARHDSQLNLPPVPVMRVDGSPSIACPPEVNPIDVSLLLRAAVECSTSQHKGAAISAGYQPDYWARVLTGERGVHLDRLGRLPEDIQRQFVTRWARQLRLRVSDDDTRARLIANLARAAVEALAELEP